MGSNTSKPNHDNSTTNITKTDDSAANSDPRSPTPEIIRTPLQGKSGPKHNITKNADLRKTFENGDGQEKLIHNNPILSAVIKNHLQSYDPRSPTQEFDRTPIVITSKASNEHLENEDYGSPSLNKDSDESNDSCFEAQESPDVLIPKNLADGFCDLTLNEEINGTTEPLGSSTASKEAIENIMMPLCNEPKTFLETNFDFIGTEEDKLKANDKTNDSTNDANYSNVMNQIPTFKILPDDPRSPSTGIERTPIVVSKALEDSTDENVEEMSDDTLIKVLQSTNADIRHSLNKTKNDGVLIYEDNSNNLRDTPKKSKPPVNTDSRTPLSCMKNKGDVTHLRSKSALCEGSKTHVPAKPRRVSHIPRLKALSKQTRVSTESTISLKNLSKRSVESGDYENTPPHSHRDKWDKDNSIVL